MSFQRDRLTLDEAMRFAGMRWVGGAQPHMTYDAKLKTQHKLVRQQRSDGTLCFAMDMMQKALEPLASGKYAHRDAPVGSIPHYIVGPIKFITTYHDRIDLPVGKFPGQRERIVVPFSVEWREAAQQSSPA